MADKFIIDGAAFNGDGTSSAAATSNGGVGAWNTIAILTGTTPAYGSLGAGDTVYIRSKTAGGADLAITSASGTINFGSAAATDSAWVTWILDNGVTWPGVSGALAMTLTGTAAAAAFRQYNHFKCLTDDAWSLANTTTNPNTSGGIACAGLLENLLLDISAKATTNTYYIRLQTGITRNVHFKLGVLGNGYLAVETTHVEMDSPRIELTSASGTYPVFDTASNSPRRVRVFGGEIYGSAVTSGHYLLDFNVVNSSNTLNLEMVGTKFPSIMQAYPWGATRAVGGYVKVFMPDGVAGSLIAEHWGDADSRDDGFYPTLNAVLPDSAATPWSWKVRQSGMPFDYRAMIDLDLGKLYTGPAGTKTLTLEFLASVDLTPSADNCWIDVLYVDDSTGAHRFHTTRGTAGAVQTSTAAWTTTTYGPKAFNKRKITFTTPTAVRQDTTVAVRFRSSLVALSANDVLFICPDVQAA